MNPTVSKQLEKLLGQLPVSRLPECDKSDQGLYLMYKGDGETKAVKDIDLFTYLFTHVYMFLLKKEITDDSLYLYIDPENYVEDGDTPLTFARKLYNAPEVRPWIDEPHPQERNISEVWFKPFQYHYFDNLDNRLPTMLLKYGEVTTGNDGWWSNGMWNSHLDPPKTIQRLPSLTTKTGEMKCLYVPESSATLNESGTVNDPENFIWSRFNRRNYIRIVDGGWDAENDTDLKWTDEVGSDETNETITDSLGVVHENIGDIDQTLISIGKYLDDAFKSIRQVNHNGKVVFTASTSQDPVNDQEIVADRKHWVNVLGNSGEEAFVWSGGGNYIGENFNAVPNLPTHHHNIDVGKMPIRNISIIGRPEGETVGGTAKVNTAEHIPVETENDTSGRAKDEPKTLTSSNPLFPTRIGAYAGTVVYTDKTVGATQIPHENKPLFYKMRAFYYKTNG